MIKFIIAMVVAASFVSGGPRHAAGQTGGRPQPPQRQISPAQREEIRSLITLIDRVATGGTAPSPTPMTWVGHFFKGVNGQVYIPYTLTLPGNPEHYQSIALYLRVVKRTADGSVPTSVVRPTGGSTLSNVPVVPGEMPVGGSGVQNPRLQAAAESSARLALVQREIERSREANRVAQLFLFEDFDFVAVEAPTGGEPYRLRRAVAVPPGDYDIYVAIKEVGTRSNARSAVLKQPLTVPDLSTPEFGISSIVVAERITPLTAPVQPNQQSEHPYALGMAEVIPAPGMQFTLHQQMSVVFQILNPASDEARKPNITVDYNFHQRQGDGETLFTVARQTFDAKVLPAGFDLSAGHQLFASQFVPLTTFQPGAYRLEIKVTDNTATKTVLGQVDFTVLGSASATPAWKPSAGLKAAPFRRDDVLKPALVGYFLDKLNVLQPDASPAIRSALEHARGGRYATVLDQVSAVGRDQLAGRFLRGLALLALSDNLEVAAVQFREALVIAPDFLPAAFYLGACHAAYGRDRQAVGAWQLTLAAEDTPPVLHMMLADAWLRLSESRQALEILNEASTRWPADDQIQRRLAMAHATAGHNREVLGVLGPYLERHMDDVDSLFLAVRIMYETKRGSRLSPEERDRLLKYAHAYAEANGPQKLLVERWVSALDKP